MHSYFMETICRTGIFIICAQVLVHFRPNGSYEKYLKLLVSAMILLQLFLPVSNLLTGDGEQSLANRVEWFQEQLQLSMEQAVADGAAGQAELECMTLEEVQSRIEELQRQAVQEASEAAQKAREGEQEASGTAQEVRQGEQETSGTAQEVRQGEQETSGTAQEVRQGEQEASGSAQGTRGDISETGAQQDSRLRGQTERIEIADVEKIRIAVQDE